MLIIGLTGGVASGKSLVSEIWRKEGAYIIDADKIARDLVKPYSVSWNKIVNVFGIEIVQEDGNINRKKLASIIFSDPEKREDLNKILHPLIKEEIQKRIDEIRKKNPQAIVVIDAPLLIERGEYHEVDKVVVITSNENNQIERIKLRNGLQKEEAKKIIESQLPLSEKLKVADFVINNDGSIEDVKKKAIEIFKEIKDLLKMKENKALNK